MPEHYHTCGELDPKVRARNGPGIMLWHIHVSRNPDLGCHVPMFSHLFCFPALPSACTEHLWSADPKALSTECTNKSRALVCTVH